MDTELIEKLAVTDGELVEKEYEGYTFRRCTLINTHIERCRFIDCTFDQCVLSACTLTNSTFTEVSFVGSKVIGIDWTKTRSVRNLSFTGCELNYSNFGFMKLPGIIIKDCVAHEVNFTETNLTEAVFAKTDLAGSIFLKTNLTKADFRDAYNYLIDVRANIMKSARFSLPEAAALLTGLDIIVT